MKHTFDNPSFILSAIFIVVKASLSFGHAAVLRFENDWKNFNLTVNVHGTQH
jgi:hypothetical protein